MKTELFFILRKLLYILGYYKLGYSTRKYILWKKVKTKIEMPKINNQKKIQGYVIKSVSNFNNVYYGDLGGFIERESNLENTKFSDCWVYANAHVFGIATIKNNAKILCGRVFDNVVVYDSASINGSCFIYENAHVGGSAQISGFAQIYGDAAVLDNAIIQDNVTISGSAIIRGDAQLLGFTTLENSQIVIEGKSIIKDCLLSNVYDISIIDQTFHKSPIIITSAFFCICMFDQTIFYNNNIYRLHNFIKNFDSIIKIKKSQYNSKSIEDIKDLKKLLNCLTVNNTEDDLEIIKTDLLWLNEHFISSGHSRDDLFEFKNDKIWCNIFSLTKYDEFITNGIALDKLETFVLEIYNTRDIKDIKELDFFYF